MRGFRSRTSVDEAVARVDTSINLLPSEPVVLSSASGRTLAERVQANDPVPPFDRAAMDGYALRGEETFGSDSYQPSVFRVVGRARPGNGFSGTIGVGEAVEITTGSRLPDGADAVARAESCECRGQALRVSEPTPPGRHVGRRGEDIAAGTVVLEPGRVLRPQDLGVLSALGRGRVAVVRRPTVSILITGDELLPPGTPARGDQIADMNSVVLSALIARDGGIPRVIGPLCDEREGLKREIEKSARTSDAVFISGGSSTGPEDYAPSIVAELGELPVHGIALRPASPAGFGTIEGVPVLLLPGNPVSCLCAYDFFGGRIVRRLGGRNADWPYRAVERPLGSKLVSALGRVDYARVRIVADRVEPLSVSGASILSSATRADGFVVVPAGLEGYPEGASVTVWLYDVTG